jgi:hypothetical protein
MMPEDQTTPVSAAEPIPFTCHRNIARKTTGAAPGNQKQSITLLQTAYHALQEAISNLEQDWNVRNQTFWQQTFATLQTIRQALSPVLDKLDMPLLNTAYLADEHIDEAGILITAHSCAQRPRREAHLRQRHQILFRLREVAGDLQEILATVNSK